MSEPERRGPEPLPQVRFRMREGLRLLESGEAAQALAMFQQAEALQPELVDAPKMMGVAAFMLGDLARAEHELSKARFLDPTRGDVLQNLGLVQEALGRTDEAIACYRAALTDEPRNMAVHELLGQALFNGGDAAGAVAVYESLLAIHPRGRGARHNLAIALAQAPYAEWTEARATLMVDLLSRADVELALLAPAIGRMICHRHALVRGDEDPPLEDLARDRLVVAALSALHLADRVSEVFLTRTRARLLEVLAGDEEQSNRLLRLAAAVALHAHANDHAHLASAEELVRLAPLEERLASCDPADPAAQRALAAVAMYRSLTTLPEADALAAIAPRAWPIALRRLIRIAIREPRLEVVLGAEVAAFGRLREESVEVRSMYEEHPYPRWQGIGFVAPLPVGAVLGSALPGWRPPAWADGRPFDVLIAGCGTGRHALRAALHYQGARVLAIDISRRSLGYARRMAQKLGVSNLEFLACDIHELPQLGRRFQLVETIGTFETLAEPKRGWEALRACLTDDGLLHVGSYSEPGRGPVVRARQRIAALGLTGSDDDMRRFRQSVIAGELGPDSIPLAACGDFYSLVGTRDFLFHVREHRFWLDELAALAGGVGLRFVGFHPLKREVREWFVAHEPAPPALADLARWAALERAEPEALAKALGLTMWYAWYEVPRG
jgi:SAM-dependent methyltransferase/Tfp pilus assembly protein PilF